MNKAFKRCMDAHDFNIDGPLCDYGISVYRLNGNDTCANLFVYDDEDETYTFCRWSKYKEDRLIWEGNHPDMARFYSTITINTDKDWRKVMRIAKKFFPSKDTPC